MNGLADTATVEYEREEDGTGRGALRAPAVGRAEPFPYPVLVATPNPAYDSPWGVENFTGETPVLLGPRRPLVGEHLHGTVLANPKREGREGPPLPSIRETIRSRLKSSPPGQ